MAQKPWKVNNNKVVDSCNRANKTIVILSHNNKSGNLTYIPNIKAIRKSIFLTFDNKKIFNHLKEAIIKALNL